MAETEKRKKQVIELIIHKISKSNETVLHTNEISLTRVDIRLLFILV
jgi:hypothetical protein